MRSSPRFVRLFVYVLATCTFAATTAYAADTVVDFDDRPVGTIVTTQYDGITFSAIGNSCGGDPVIHPIIVIPEGGTSSPTHGLSLQTGCPDFSSDYLRMVFDVPHGAVSFTLGATAGSYRVRAYSTTSGDAGLVFSQTVTLATSGGFAGVFRLVRIERAGDDIRRVEVESLVGDFEVIDDLRFDCADDTSPIADITFPEGLACVCNSSEIRGSANDPDGAFARYTVHRRSPTVSAWTLITSRTTEVTDGLLTNWVTAAEQGYYMLRLFAENGCGLTAEDMTVVWLDKHLDRLTLRAPSAGAILGGLVCADGSAWDMCPGTFTVERRPAGGGAFVPFDTLAPPWVLNDPLGTWNSRAVPDGKYEVRLSAEDGCANAASAEASIIIDNTPPTVEITTPLACACVNGLVEIRGTVTDTNLNEWVLQYAAGHAHNWVTITSGTGKVINDRLGLWETRALPECEYALRLVAADLASVDCTGDPNRSEYVVPLEVGPCASFDFDADDDGDVDLADYLWFLDEFTGP